MKGISRELFDFRELVIALTSRELKARYRGSALGILWSMMNPLLLTGVYTLVFDVVMQGSRVGADPYAVYLVSGLFPWIWMSTSLLEGAVSLSANAGLLRKAAFPSSVLPTVSVVSNLIHFIFALPIVGLALGLARLTHHPVGGWGLFALPLVMLITLPFLVGGSLAISSLSVHFKDLRDLIANILTLFFFLSPIIYTMDLLVGKGFWVKWVVLGNPFTPFIMAYQSVLFLGEFPPWRLWVHMGALSFFAWVVGTWVFDRLSETLVESV